MKKSIPALTLLFCLGCNFNELDFDNLKGPTLNSHVAIPIGELSYSMRDLINEVADGELQLEEDSTSLLQLTYFDSASFNSGQDVINIDDVTNNALIAIPQLEATPDSRQEVIDTVFVFSYPAENDEALDSVFYESGILRMVLNSNLANDINYEFDIENTRQVSNNTAVSFTGAIGGFGSVTDSRDLEGHKTLLISQGDSNVFQVSTRITIFLGPGESTSGSEDLSISVSYLDQEFDVLYGKFGQDTITVGDEVLNIAFFDDLGDSGLKFGAPEIYFNFSSTFGLPLGILFDGMYGAEGDSLSGDTTYLEGPVTREPQVVNESLSPGTPRQSTITINHENSTLRDLLQTSPSSVGFNLRAITNPDDATQQNFVMDTSRINTAIVMNMPLELSLDDVVQIVDFDLGGGLNFDEAETLTLRIISENELPFSAKVQLEILNENDTVIHTVPEELVLEIPYLNVEGLVIEPRKHIADIPLDVDGVNALRNGSKLQLRLTLNTPPSNATRELYVKVLADYSISIKVAAVGTLKAEL